MDGVDVVDGGPIRQVLLGTATREGTLPVDRTGAAEEVGSGAVEVAVGVVGTTGTRRRTLPSFPTFEGINARYVRGIVRVSRGGCLPAMPRSLEQTGALPSSLGDSVTR